MNENVIPIVKIYYRRENYYRSISLRYPVHDRRLALGLEDSATFVALSVRFLRSVRANYPIKSRQTQIGN